MSTQNRDKAAAERLVDYAGTSCVYEGEQVKMADIENVEVTVLAFNYAESTYRENEQFLSMQVRVGKKLCVLNTNAKVIMKGFRNVPKEKLPLAVKFFMDTPKGGGKQYWNIG